MPTSETIVFDPPELAPNREPLGLDELGIRVDVEGADWGESTVAVQLAEQQIGSTVTRRHLDPVEMTIPLQVLEQGEVSLAEAAYRLQQKVGIAQADEYDTTWIRRDFDDGFGAAGSVAYQVHTAALQGLQGWLMAHRQHAPDVVLKILRSPLCYATEEIDAGTFSVEGARAAEFEIAEVLGSGPGLLSLHVKNLGAAPWRACAASLESRDHPQDATAETTAKLTYEAEALTPMGGAVIAERAGASGGKVVRATLTAGWVAFLGSKIAGVGHMTHVGPRLIMIRTFDPTGAAELQVEYRPLGAITWTPTRLIKASPVANDWALYELGECQAERAVLGDQRWEWRILGRAPGGSGSIDIDLVHLEPVEQRALVVAPTTPPQADKWTQKSAGKGSNDASLGEVEWAGAENIKASDNSRATVSLDAAFAPTSQYLVASQFAFALPEGAIPLGIVASVERSCDAPAGLIVDASVRIVKGGAIVGADKSASSVNWPFLSDVAIQYGASNDLWGVPWLPSDINSPSFGVAIAAKCILGAFTARIDHIALTVYYTESADDVLVCFQGRSIEFRPEGVFRQDATDDVWGELVNEGNNLYAPPSYMEGRKLRGLIVPSAGDLAASADTGSHDLEVEAGYRPAYHFAREALSS